MRSRRDRSSSAVRGGGGGGGGDPVGSGLLADMPCPPLSNPGLLGGIGGSLSGVGGNSRVRRFSSSSVVPPMTRDELEQDYQQYVVEPSFQREIQVIGIPPTIRRKQLFLNPTNYLLSNSIHHKFYL